MPGLMKVALIGVNREREGGYLMTGHWGAFDDGLRELNKTYEVDASGITPIQYYFGDGSYTKELLVPVSLER